jgi:hypothetical protein
LVLLLPACGRDTPSGPAGPPVNTAQAAKLFDGRLRPLGWRVQRAELADQQYTSTTVPGRHHLAVYVRPVGTPTNADYVEGLADVTKVFVPLVFDRYPEILSFDVCEEPTEAIDPSDEPKPVTQVLIRRDQLPMVDWRKATPREVVAGSTGHPNAVGLYISPELRKSPEWIAVRPGSTPGG